MLLPKHVTRFAFESSRVDIIFRVEYSIRPCRVDFGFSVQKSVSKWMSPTVPRRSAEVGSFKRRATRSDCEIVQIEAQRRIMSVVGVILIEGRLDRSSS